MKKTKEYNLVITPGIAVDVRHKIQKVLEDNGYLVTNAGTFFGSKMQLKESNIVFIEKPKK